MAAITGKQLINASRVFTDGDFVTYDVMKEILDSGVLADVRDAFVAKRKVDRDALRASLNLQPVRKGLDMSRLPTWKRIAVGTHGSGIQLRTSIILAGMDVSPKAQELLESTQFCAGDKRMMMVEFLVVTVRELGFRNGAGIQEIMEAGSAIPNCVYCDAEDGPCIRFNYRDQPIGERLCVAMNPLTDSNGRPYIFAICNDTGQLLLEENATEAVDFHPSTKFIFVRHIPK